MNTKNSKFDLVVLTLILSELINRSLEADGSYKRLDFVQTLTLLKFSGGHEANHGFFNSGVACVNFDIGKGLHFVRKGLAKLKLPFFKRGVVVDVPRDLGTGTSQREFLYYTTQQLLSSSITVFLLLIGIKKLT